MELKIAIGQMKAKACDIAGNAEKVLGYLQEAESQKADLLILPEACLVGYPCGDIANRPNFIRQSEEMTQNIIAKTKGVHCAVLFGALSTSEKQDIKVAIEKPHNSAILAQNGKLIAKQHKALLPNYDVFHEERNFSGYALPSPIDYNGVKIGLLVCNDMWYEEPPKKLCNEGAEILIVSNGSPYHEAGIYNDDKLTQRIEFAKKRVQETALPLLFVNAEGGQDDLVFDGQSFILNKDNKLACLLPAFDNSLYITDWKKTTGGWECVQAHNESLQDKDALTYKALVVGLKDYADKCGFAKVVLGLSGGIDSALVACIAKDALGAKNVLGICMPSEFSSAGSLTDAQALAKNLGIECETISIESLRKDFMNLMNDYKDDIAGENIQARLRGNILMYIANASGRLLLATGNKSESAMGYATLYGDMCGGFAPISDLYKMRVFALAGWVNSHYKSEVIPKEILNKPPSAELRPNQKDEDSLPPYNELDPMLEFLIENNGDWNNASGVSFSKAEADALWKQVCGCEYKRSQSAVGCRVTTKAFGSGWAYPIAHGYKSEAL